MYEVWYKYSDFVGYLFDSEHESESDAESRKEAILATYGDLTAVQITPV